MRHDLHLSRGPASAFAAMAFFWGAFAALAPALKDGAGLSDGGFGLALLAATGAAVAAMAVAPAVAARTGPRGLPASVVAVGVTMGGLGLVDGPVGFTLWLALACAGMGLMDVLMNAQVSRLEAASGRTLMNLNHGLYSLVYAPVAVAAGVARWAGASPEAIFAALGLGTVGLAVLSRRGIGLSAEHHRAERRPVPPGWALLAPAGAIVCLAFLAEQAAEGWSALHLERGQAAGPAASAVGPALLGLTMGVGRLGGQVAAQVWSHRMLLAAGASLAAAGAALAAWAPVLPLAYLGFAALGLGLSTIVPTTFAWVGARLGAGAREGAIARLSIVGYAGFFFGPPAMGGVAELAGLDAAFTLVAVLLVAIPAVLLPALVRGETALIRAGHAPVRTGEGAISGSAAPRPTGR